MENQNERDEIEIDIVELFYVLWGHCLLYTSGDVHRFKNRDAFKSYVEQQGGKVTGSVSAKTNFLINNDSESSSGKNRKAKELGIPILTEDEFIERF